MSAKNRPNSRPRLVLFWRAGSGPDLSLLCSETSFCFHLTGDAASLFYDRECCSLTGSDRAVLVARLVACTSHAQRLDPRCSGLGFESDLWPFAACRPLSHPVISKLSYQNKAIKNKIPKASRLHVPSFHHQTSSAKLNFCLSAGHKNNPTWATLRGVVGLVGGEVMLWHLHSFEGWFLLWLLKSHFPYTQ